MTNSYWGLFLNVVFYYFTNPVIARQRDKGEIQLPTGIHVTNLGIACSRMNS